MNQLPTWSAGYVTDVAYVPGYYAEQSPEFIRFAMLLTGHLPPALDEPQPRYCELGFGYGLGLAILGATHPHMDVWGHDFMPDQVSFARGLVEGICPNVHLTDDSFEEFLQRDTPGFDYITLHGIWSWVSPANQRAILEILKNKLKLGGAVYISYNALPGWHPVAPLRGLLAAHASSASRAGDGAVTKVQRAIAAVEQMAQNKAPAIVGNGALMERLQSLKTAPPAYVAHEYLNAHWHPCYFTDVAAAVQDAKLHYVGSSRILHMVDSVNLSPAALQHLQTIGDSALRETMRDYYLNTAFRQDVYTRGARRLSAAEREQRLDAVKLVAVASAGDVKLAVKTALGEVKLHEDVYRPILDRLQQAGAAGMTIADLGTSAGLKDKPRPAVIEAACLLIAAGAAFPVVDQRKVEAEAPAAALNRRIAQWNANGYGVDYVASAISRNGHGIDRLQGFIVEAYRDGLRDEQSIAQRVWKVMQRTGQRSLKDGKPLETADQNLGHLRELAHAFLKDGYRRYELLGLL